MKYIYSSLILLFWTFSLFSQNKYEKDSIVEVLEFKNKIEITNSKSTNYIQDENILKIEKKVSKTQDLKIFQNDSIPSFEIKLNIEKSDVLIESKNPLKIHNTSEVSEDKQGSTIKFQYLPVSKKQKQIDYRIIDN